MENLLRDLNTISYTADDIQRRRDEQAKEWLNSRRPEVSQGAAKRRRFNRGAREFGAQEMPSNDGRSEPVAIARTAGLPKSSETEHSGTQSST